MTEHEADDTSRDRTCPYCDEEDPSEAHGIECSKKATTDAMNALAARPDYTNIASLPAEEREAFRKLRDAKGALHRAEFRDEKEDDPEARLEDE